MSRVEAALERLPWLSDIPATPRTHGFDSSLAGWIAAMIGVIAVAGWIDTRRNDELPLPTSTTTVRLPPARIIEPPAAVQIVEPVSLSPPRVQAESVTAPSPLRRRTTPRAKTATARPEPTVGRTIRVGAFGSARQAEAGLYYMREHYPGVSGLPSSVRTSRNSKGRSFYRFQMRTTSQAHSEMLCQRMRRIDLSCEVVGVPRKVNAGR